MSKMKDAKIVFYSNPYYLLLCSTYKFWMDTIRSDRLNREQMFADLLRW